jgi:hypothetical protein
MVAGEVPPSPFVQDKTPRVRATDQGGQGVKSEDTEAPPSSAAGSRAQQASLAAPESRSVPLTPRNASQAILEVEGLPPPAFNIQPVNLPKAPVTTSRAAFPSPFPGDRRRCCHTWIVGGIHLTGPNRR